VESFGNREVLKDTINRMMMVVVYLKTLPVADSGRVIKEAIVACFRYCRSS
jgi:hypothetical protein